jgi:phytoene dehydrogenase-like protein
LIPVQVACLDVALRHLPQPKYGIVQDGERPLFMSAQSLASKVAPEGGALVYTFKQLDPRTATDPENDEKELESLLDAAQLGWRDVLVKRQFLPSIEAVGALPSAKAGGFSGRPGVNVPGFSNLYLAGDWVGPRGFLCDASFSSAKQAAQEIVNQMPEHSSTNRSLDASVSV